MNTFNRKERIKELETELRILDNLIYCRVNGGKKFHAHNNKTIIRYLEVERELVKLSFKWKLKKIFGGKKV